MQLFIDLCKGHGNMEMFWNDVPISYVQRYNHSPILPDVYKRQGVFAPIVLLSAAAMLVVWIVEKLEKKFVTWRKEL